MHIHVKTSSAIVGSVKACWGSRVQCLFYKDKFVHIPEFVFIVLFTSGIIDGIHYTCFYTQLLDGWLPTKY